MDHPPDITQLLKDAGKGEQQAYNKLLPLVYDELRQIASAHLHLEYSEHTLCKTELVHEAYLKLVDQTKIDFNDRKHFYAVAARAMRQFLVDYARKKKAKKRGGEKKNLLFDEEQIHLDEHAAQFLKLDEYLDELGKLNERLAKVVEYRFFIGLSMKEISMLLGLAEITIKRDWAKAKGWLYIRLQQEENC